MSAFDMSTSAKKKLEEEQQLVKKLQEKFPDKLITDDARVERRTCPGRSDKFAWRLFSPDYNSTVKMCSKVSIAMILSARELVCESKNGWFEVSLW